MEELLAALNHEVKKSATVLFSHLISSSFYRWVLKQKLIPHLILKTPKHLNKYSNIYMPCSQLETKNNGSSLQLVRSGTCETHINTELKPQGFSYKKIKSSNFESSSLPKEIPCSLDSLLSTFKSSFYVIQRVYCNIKKNTVFISMYYEQFCFIQ